MWVMRGVESYWGEGVMSEWVLDFCWTQELLEEFAIVGQKLLVSIKNQSLIWSVKIASKISVFSQKQMYHNNVFWNYKLFPP